MIITEYSDCFSIKYIDIPDVKIDRKTQSIAVELGLLNGRETEIELAVRRKKDGTQKVVEILLDKDLSEEDVGDIADLHWYLFPKKERGRKILPVLNCWENNGTVLVACLHPKYGIEKKSFAEQQGFLENEDISPGADRLLCWWPDPRAWETMRDTKNQLKYLPVKGIAFPFYTFSEWFKRPDTEDAEDRGVEYARHIRRLRTMLLYCRLNSIEVKLTVGNVQRAYSFFSENKLDPSDPISWAAAADAFEEMPDILVERRFPCGPAGVLNPKNRITATISYFSHLTDSPSMDCVAASICSGETPLCDVIVWPNPLAGGKAYEEAAVAISNALQEYGVEEAFSIDGVLPFRACPGCGGMSLPSIDETGEKTPVRRGPKIGRNDPCPCGSGKKYKNCCGRDAEGID